jgi:hypothetical protein
MDAFEVGGINASDYTERTASLTAQIETVQKDIAELEDTRLKDQTRREQLTKLSEAVDSLEYYFLNAPPHEVNAQLRGLIERIEISKSDRVKFTWL